MTSPLPLEMGTYYCIFNRGNGGVDIFRERRNYLFFLERYAQYVEPVACTYAYCLMRSHFHLLVQTRTPEEQEAFRETMNVSKAFRVLEPSRQFRKLFNSYAKAFNKVYDRTGSLFEHPFHRIMVDADTYFDQLVVYVHQNPQKHGFVSDFREWPYSSYRVILSQQPAHLERDEVIEWFGGVDKFVDLHSSKVILKEAEDL
jgi:hypothetical protein